MKRILTVLLAAILTALAGVAVAMPARATSSKMALVDCESLGIRPSSIGGVPVLMVHGFNSDPRIWRLGAETMLDAVNLVPGARAVEPFDYEAVNTAWVTNPGIGERLAKTIYCWAEASSSGKAVVLAHSMGGLALREAASWTINGVPTAGRVGLAVTIGTPHLGARMANLGGFGLTQLCESTLAGAGVSIGRCHRSNAIRGMAQGSRELKELPPLPSTVPLRAIAGDVTVYRFWDRGTDTDSDLVVKVDSATAEYTSGYPGDGRSVFSCTAEAFLWHVGPAACEHSALLWHAGVQASVIQAIGEYLDSLESSSGSPSTGAPSDEPDGPTPTFYPHD